MDVDMWQSGCRVCTVCGSLVLVCTSSVILWM